MYTILTEESNQFELYTGLVDEFSYTELKDERKEILDISNISPEFLQDKIINHLLLRHIEN